MIDFTEASCRAAPARRRMGHNPAPARRPLHAVLLLDKPLGLSSNDALQQARRLFRAEKAGHTGTLDPLATGLLPICFGAATKFSQASLEADKRYRATLQLGVATTTGDREGEVVSERPVVVTPPEVLAACRRMVGRSEQVPPMHSAVKRGGKALYEYARAGVEVERSARSIIVHSVEVVANDGTCLVIDVVCSKGTYIRALAVAIGEALGCGAHLAALRRTGSGALRVDDAITLDELQAMDEAARDRRLLRPDALLPDWPAVRLPDDDAGRFLGGLRRRVALGDAAAVRVYGPALQGPGATARHEPGAFLGIAHIQGGELIADRLLSPAEVAALANS
jgi:tRNA pseudouridine55 synthase